MEEHVWKAGNTGEVDGCTAIRPITKYPISFTDPAKAVIALTDGVCDRNDPNYLRELAATAQRIARSTQRGTGLYMPSGCISNENGVRTNPPMLDLSHIVRAEDVEGDSNIKTYRFIEGKLWEFHGAKKRPVCNFSFGVRSVICDISPIAGTSTEMFEIDICVKDSVYTRKIQKSDLDRLAEYVLKQFGEAYTEGLSAKMLNPVFRKIVAQTADGWKSMGNMFMYMMDVIRLLVIKP